FAQVRFARHYAALGGPYAYDRFTLGNYLSGLRGSTMWFIGSRLLITAPALVAILLGGVVGRDRGVRVAALLLAAAFAGVAMQAKFFIYHWQVTLPFLALLAGWSAQQLWRLLVQRFSRLRAALTAAMTVAGLLFLTPQVTDAGFIEWRDAARY